MYVVYCLCGMMYAKTEHFCIEINDICRFKLVMLVQCNKLHKHTIHWKLVVDML